jgi:phosphoribosyl-AMP cyclohydrolase
VNPVTSSEVASSVISALKWTADGLVPAIVQDAESGDVLMMAWLDATALRQTLLTGQTHFYSRSRKSAWHKGGTSGHVQDVVGLYVDCDADVLLIKARQVGGACHEGYRSCFFRRIDAGGGLEIIAEPVFEAESVYGPARPANPDSPDLSVPKGAER